MATNLMQGEGPKVLTDDSVQFLGAMGAGGLTGFAAYHFGLEVIFSLMATNELLHTIEILVFLSHPPLQEEVVVLSLDWICVSEDARRKGLGEFLLQALEATAQRTQMKGAPFIA